MTETTTTHQETQHASFGKLGSNGALASRSLELTSIIVHPYPEK